MAATTATAEIVGLTHEQEAEVLKLWNKKIATVAVRGNREKAECMTSITDELLSFVRDYATTVRESCKQLYEFNSML